MKRIWNLATDHLARTLRALEGFRLFGNEWLRPWLYFAFLPILSRLRPRHILDFGLFKADAHRCDLDTFGGLFLDYPIATLRPALANVRTVIDAGANAGAFSWLVDVLTNGMEPMRVVAVEPDEEMCRFMEEQPFSGRIEILRGALGPDPGWCRLTRGPNSVSHTIEPIGPATNPEDEDGRIPVFAIDSLSKGPTLLKMDIEGSEHAIFARPVPMNVDYIVLEWHPNKAFPRAKDPRRLVPYGEWKCLSRDMYGLSTWFWKRI